MRQSLNKVNEINKVIDKNGYSINNIIINVMKKFNFKSLCNKSGATLVKEDGYSVTETLTLMIILPLLLIKSVNALYRSQYTKITEMKKDVIYRLKNNEKMPWRNLLYCVNKKFQQLINPENKQHSKSAFILDDTADVRTGYKMEKITVIHNHGSGKKGYVYGYKKLVLAHHEGVSTTPLDFSIHIETKLKKKQQKKQYKKNCNKNTNGYKRRKECNEQKNTNGLIMIKRAVKHGFLPKFVLVDSWFCSEDFIKTIREIKNGAMHVVCGVKRIATKYEFEGKKLNIKEIIKKLRHENKEKRCRKFNSRYYEIIVNFNEIGSIKMFVCRFPYQKEWRIFLSTNTELSFNEFMETYSIRWTIEVLFKECKQHLGFCKCQSRDFDAQIADATISFILYIFLSYYRRVNDYESLGGLFELIGEDIREKNLAQRIWELFEELIDIIIVAISESGIVDIKLFKKCPEYKYIKELFEKSFLSNDILTLSA